MCGVDFTLAVLSAFEEDSAASVQAPIPTGRHAPWRCHRNVSGVSEVQASDGYVFDGVCFRRIHVYQRLQCDDYQRSFGGWRRR